MAPPKPLSASALARRTDSSSFTFKTTAELEPLNDALGQDRAIEAIEFGIGMRQEGYNMFALGPTGIGKHRMVRLMLERQAADEPAPPDWCYVHNFTDPHKPRVLSLPPGRARPFRADMAQLIEELRITLPAAFESEDYRTQRHAIEDRMKDVQEAAFTEFQKKAESRNVSLIRTPTGLALAPTRGGEVLSPEDFNKLPDDQQDAIRREIDTLQEELQGVLQKMPQWEREHRTQVRDLNQRVAQFAIAHPLDELKRRYADLPDLVAHLNAVQNDMVENARDFLRPQETPQGGVMPPGVLPGTPDDAQAAAAPFTRYKVNVIIDNGSLKGAPVIYEDNPTHPNLFGKIEHRALFGALVTDFNLILSGALHRANGGYLIVDARKVLMQPFGWEELKHALRSREIRIEPAGQALGIMGTVSLEPQPIPLDVKVLLLGERQLYYLLAAYDPEFNELFKVPVDFEDRVVRDGDNAQMFPRFLAGLIESDKLRPFDQGAVARVMDRAARLAEDSERLSTQLQSVGALLREADYWAGRRNAAIVTHADVDKAVAAQIRRSDRTRERLQEEVERGTILIDTDGQQAGQINGLSVIQLGEYSFGRPSRITASVALGKGEVLDIEREVALGGPLHSKGVLILQGFLLERYGGDRPLSLKASLVFEQSYGGVDGDSASSTELYALLSALSGCAINQSLAVTGSVNQHGHVQAIGGVNEKIEGFFDLCKARGLTGRQGVLIPASNTKHLMLRDEVVEAASKGQFSIYAIETIDQGIEVLTGVPAGDRDGQGRYPPESINGRVQARLDALAEAARRFAHPDRKEPSA